MRYAQTYNLSFLTLIYKYVEKYDNPCQPE